MESSAKTRLPLHFIAIIYPSLSLRFALHFGIIFTHILFAKGGEKVKGLSKTPFLVINAKGGESISPKQKDRTTTPISKNFETKFLLYSIGIPLRNSISFDIYILRRSFSKMVSKIFDLLSICKTLLNTKRRISLRGSFV
jgi:hypothetical protein